MRRRVLVVLVALVGSTTALVADVTATPETGWIPEYQQLTTSAGYQYFRTNANFDDAGALTDPVVGGQPITLVESRFRLGVEYGVAQDWAFGLRGGFHAASADAAGGAVASGSGLADVELGIKWNFNVMAPILTFELFTRLPVSSTDAGANDVVVTDGSVDVGVRLYTGHRAGRMLFSLAPAFVYRAKSYSPLLTVDGLIRFDFIKGYVQGMGNFTYAIDDASRPFYSAPNTPDAAGAVGSFARLNGAPTGFWLGGGVGFKVYEEWMVEGAFSHAVYGVRYPNFMSVYVGIRTLFDFFKPIKPKRVKEVPFEEDNRS